MSEKNDENNDKENINRDKKNENSDEKNENSENENIDSQEQSRSSSNNQTESSTEKDNDQIIEPTDSEVFEFYAKYQKSSMAYVPTMDAFVNVYMKIPPDGGYAWIILGIAIIETIFIDGTLFGVGRILPDMIKDMKISQSTAAFVVSVQTGLYFAIGPVASILVNKLGFRIQCVSGIFITMLGIFIGSYATNFAVLCIFYGIVGGIGLGIASLSIQMVVGFHFEKYRAIACGIVSAGSGVGVLVYSPFNNYLVQKIGWRNTIRSHMLILSIGIFLSLFLRQVLPTKIGKYLESPDDETDTTVESLEIAYDRYSKFLSHTPDGTSIIMSTIPEQSYPNSKQSNFTFKNFKRVCLTRCACCKKSEHELAPEPEPDKKIKLSLIKYEKDLIIKKTNLNENKSIVNEKKSNINEKKSNINEKKSNLLARSKRSSFVDKKSVILAKTDSSSGHKIIIDVKPLDRQDIFYAGNPKYMDVESKFDEDYVTIIPGKEKQAQALNYTIGVVRDVGEQKIYAKKTWYNYIISKFNYYFRILFDPKVLQSKEFVIFCIAQFSFYMGSIVPYLYISTHAKISKEYANLLLSTIGLLNTFLRALAGIIAFTFEINPILLTAVTVFIAGIITIFEGFILRDSVWFQFFFCITFAVGNACNSSFRTISIVYILGLEKLTSGFGFQALGLGIGSFVGTNVAGILITQAHGDTSYAFAFSGLVITISGLLIICMRPIVLLLGGDTEPAKKNVRFE